MKMAIVMSAMKMEKHREKHLQMANDEFRPWCPQRKY